MTRPLSGWYTPLIRLISELLPAPLGPMIARISPETTDRSTPESAVMPPNDRLTCSSDNASSAARRMPARGGRVLAAEVGAPLKGCRAATAPACMALFRMAMWRETADRPPRRSCRLSRSRAKAAWRARVRARAATRADRRTRPPPGSAGSRQAQGSPRCPSASRCARRSAREYRPDRS